MLINCLVIFRAIRLPAFPKTSSEDTPKFNLCMNMNFADSMNASTELILFSILSQNLLASIPRELLQGLSTLH